MVFCNSKAPAVLSAFFAVAGGTTVISSEDNVGHVESDAMHNDLLFVPSKIAQERARSDGLNGSEIDNNGVMESLYEDSIPFSEKKLMNEPRTSEKKLMNEPITNAKEVTPENVDPALDLGVLGLGKSDVSLPELVHDEEWSRGLDETGDDTEPCPYRPKVGTGDRTDIFGIVRRAAGYNAETFRRAIDSCLRNYIACPYPNVTIGCWDVSDVTDMERAFQYSGFNGPLNSWDVGSVTNMNEMFFYNRAFNQPLDAWDVSNVGNFRAMFYEARRFNQPLDMWQVTSATNMNAMFYIGTPRTFNQCLSTWPQKVSYNQSRRMFGRVNNPFSPYGCPVFFTYYVHDVPFEVIGNTLPFPYTTWCQGTDQGCIAPNCNVYAEDFSLCGPPVQDDNRRRLQEEDESGVCGCDNDPLFTFKGKTCADIAALSAKKRKRKCKKDDVKTNCPGVCVCDNIDPLADTNCAELSELPNFRELCDLVPNVAAQCSGLCEGEDRCPCVNSLEPFQVNGKTKTCDEIDALDEEKREKQCAKKKVNKNCPGVCNCRKTAKEDVIFELGPDPDRLR